MVISKSFIPVSWDSLGGEALGLVISIAQLAKVVAHRRQAQRLGESVAMFCQGVTKEAPELFTFTIQHAQLDRDPRKGRDTLEEVVVLGIARTVRRSFQRIAHSLIVLTRAIDRLHNALVSLNKPRGIHFGHEIQRTV